MLRIASFFMAVCLVLTGCATVDQNESIFVLLPDEDGIVGEVAVSNEAGERVLSRAGESVTVRDRSTMPSEPSILEKPAIEQNFKEVLSARPKRPLRFLLYFQEGTRCLTETSVPEFEDLLQTINDRSFCIIQIIGHSDTFGSEQQNHRRGLQRAVAVKRLLLLNCVPWDWIHIDSQGETNLLVPTGDNVKEFKNQGVEVFVF